MKRENSYFIKYMMEEWVPPAFRDTRFFSFLMQKAFDDAVVDWAEFRKTAHTATPDDFDHVYSIGKHVHSTTDCTDASIDFVKNSIVGNSVCDVGCGQGLVLKSIASSSPDIERLIGVDFKNRIELDDASDQVIEFMEGSVESLPLEDNAVDTVVCTHTLEHVYDIRHALSELRRIARKRVVVVVPKEREALYTFNIHLHFFPYLHSFLRHVIPQSADYHASEEKNEIFYYENLD